MGYPLAELDAPDLTALAMTAGGVLLALSCLLSRLGVRLGVPVSLIFLVIGMLAGCDGPGSIEFEEFSIAYAVGTLALAAVLFAGGLQTPVHCVKTVVGPAAVLATLGVVGIATITAWFTYWVGRPWHEACLVGAIVSSTDASAVFSILSGVKLPSRVAHTIELESGLNDPMAVILTLAMTHQMLGHPLSMAQLALDVLYQLVAGAAFGLALGYLARIVLIRVPLSTPALNPVLTLGVALTAFGAAAVLGGSGFLAVYVAGIVVGNSKLPHHEQVLHVHDSLSWLSQVSMFLLLGLLVNPSELPAVMWAGALVAMALTFVARPLVVYLCLLPFRYTWRERVFISWVGLRGAVPIIMATVPVLQAHDKTQEMVEALDVFDLVFFIVIISSFVPGAVVKPVARWLGIDASGTAPTAPVVNSTVPNLFSVGT
jgi:cell volume regulation protein A